MSDTNPSTTAVIGGPLDRAIGALVGLATGDAVGTTLEFKAPGTFTPITDMVGGGPFGLEPGQWTDDTSMALCLAASLVEKDGVDLVDQLERYVRWRDQGYMSSTGRCFDIGNTTTSQLSRFVRTGEPIDPNTDQESAANGSLMRLAPVPIRWWRDPAEAAERSAESSRTTHAADRPVDACRVLGAMIAALIGGQPADEVFAPDFWRWGDLHPQVEAVARGSWRDKEPPAIRGTGYCVAALEAAIWAVAGAADFREAALRAANLGDDADTTAAIAGQLAGARWGASDIPMEWAKQVTMVEDIARLAQELFDAESDDRPVDAAPTSRPADLPDPWPHEQEIHAWWVEPGRVLAGEYPGNKDRDRAIEKIDLLVDAGVRTFVDLTEEGERDLRPYAGLVAQVAEARDLDLRHHLAAPADDAIGREHELLVGRTGQPVGAFGDLGCDHRPGGRAYARRAAHRRFGRADRDREQPRAARHAP